MLNYMDPTSFIPLTKNTYTQVLLQYEPFDNPNEKHLDTIYIPTKYAKLNKIIIVDEPYKRNAKVLEVYNTVNKVERKLWNNNI